MFFFRRQRNDVGYNKLSTLQLQIFNLGKSNGYLDAIRILRENKMIDQALFLSSNFPDYKD